MTTMNEERAAIEAAYASVAEGGWDSVKDMGIQMFQAGAAWQRAQAAVVPEPVRDALARRCLWLAFCWNDHNFGPAHEEARKEALKHGIGSFDAANEWLAAAPAHPAERPGYMPIPTAEQVAEALANVRCFHDLSAELIAPELLANLLAAAPAAGGQGGDV